MLKKMFDGHKKLIVRAAAALCAVCVFALSVCVAPFETVSASNFDNDSKVKGYQDQIKKLDEQMKQLNASIASSKKDLASVQKDKENYDKLVASYMEKIDLTNALIEEKRLSIEQKNGEIDGKQTDYENKFELFKLRLRVTHEEGSASYLEMLLGSESIADFLARVDRVGAMIEYDKKIMNTLKSEKADLEDIRTSLEAEKAELEKLAAELASDEEEMQKKADEAQQMINKLQSDIATSQAYQEQNEKLRAQFLEELEKRVKELEEEQKRRNSKYVGGEMMWPVPLDYTLVTSGCVWRTSPITGRAEFHNGIDIPAKLGTPVYAANAGTVVIATSHWSYGNYIMIDHGGGIFTLYAHNSQLLVKVGDTVKKGQTIAKVGSTGSSTGNHCHFSVRKDGQYIDPMQYFK